MSNRFTLAAFALLVLAAGCQHRQPTAGDVAKGRRMVALFQTLDNPFFVELNEGIKEVVEAHGDRLITLDSKWNSSRQAEQISDLIRQEAAAMFVNPVDWEGIQASLLEARQKGVPCVVVDAPVSDPSLVLCQVASDNVEAGRMAARVLAHVPRPAQIVILHIPANKACIDRVDGFKEELAKSPGRQILEICDGKGTREGAQPAMAGLLQKYPNVNVVFAVNDPIALGAIAALEAAGKRRQVTVVSVDGSPAGIAAIKAGKLYSTSAQFPREIGRIAAQRVYDHLDGEAVEKNLKVPVELITPENVNAFYPHK
jgi:ribose transport system substrate-binding protein